MLASVSAAFESVRRPEFTGNNRCVPCTAFHVSLAVALSILLAIVTTPFVATVAFVGFVTVIYFRGYLFPGTPRLAKRLVLRRPRRSSGATTDNSDAVTAVDGDRLESLVRSLDVVDDRGPAGYRLEPEFRDAWHDRIDEIRAANSRLEVLSTQLGLDPDRVVLEVTSSGFAANYGRNRIGCWPSEAALLADLAATPELEARAPRWRTLGAEERSALLAELRGLLERCPNCNGTLERVGPAADSCGSTATRGANGCRVCGSRLVERHEGIRRAPRP
ncbi:hypothetical protein [Natrarchaeobaculum sulfurireducens]|uniref:Uncharacterized protein n=1 Tax=Natrarchaeobaculum sulfurireducens TaxID=2044521 RepID=A0A346PHX5_9EURY|nr:hypothetical protein [Natrarchaeobaculum sulfurireducens]AXR79120.1 hypothetical protein AArc1_2808 [Natrarchaeobaculum sulfurireducens]